VDVFTCPVCKVTPELVTEGTSLKGPPRSPFRSRHRSRPSCCWSVTSSSFG